MGHGIAGIDHPVVAVADLGRARDRFARLGFVTTPRRRFQNWGTANHAVMFADDYIELLGIVDRSAFLTPGLADFLAVGEGIMAVTMRGNDVAAAHTALAADGYQPTAPSETTIHVEDPGGPIPQSFRWFRIGAKTPDLYLMVVQPLRPENMRRPAWLAHPNSAYAVTGVTVVVANPAELRAAYEALFAASAAPEPDGSFAIASGHGTFRFVTRVRFTGDFPSLDPAPGRPVPTIAALAVGVRDLAVARRVLAANGVVFADRGSQLVVPPEAAGGFVLTLGA